MKRFVTLTVLFIIVLCGCDIQPDDFNVLETTESVYTEPVTEPVVTQAPETQPEHSSLYIPGLPAEDVIKYYNEVVLSAEFVNSGDPSRVQKWEDEILYIINGEPTPKDREVLQAFTAWLNTVEGFPGIRETSVDAEANLRIHFCTYEKLLQILGDNFQGMDGGVTFWDDNDRIYQGTICIRTDLEQELRNSVILEEIYNGLGPVQDTDLREDSIAYSGFSQPQSLTVVDELILKLLYHPQIQCGMDASQCETVIRQLYY